MTRPSNNRFIILFCRNRLAVLLVSAVILLALGWLDYITGDYSLIIFYIIPVALTSWFAGSGYGLTFCILAAGVRIVSDEIGRSLFSQNSVQHYWNVFMEFVFLLITGYLLSLLKKSLDR